MPRAVLKLPNERAVGFWRYITQHQEVESFQKIGSCFIIKTSHKDEEEYASFIGELIKVFQVISKKELCRGECRDNTGCLNAATEGFYCWKHSGDKKC